MMDFPQPEMIEVNGIELEVFSVGAGKPIVLCQFSFDALLQPKIRRIILLYK